MSQVDETHPRDRFTLSHIELQGQALESAMARGRLPHAWLLAGPQGLGKASFAFRAARRLLGAKSDPRFGVLGASPEDQVCRLISARAHPDLLVLERDGEGGRRSIPVEEARRLPEYFSKAPALGGRRIAIVDAADDLNVNGANALLKTLEEPSGHGVLFLVAHAPGRILQTIKSRCRVLLFKPWPIEDVADLLSSDAGVDPQRAAVLADMSRGSPGRAMQYARNDVVEIERFARALTATDGRVAKADLLRACDGFRGEEGGARFALLVDRVGAAIQARALAQGGQGGAAWAELWERLGGLSAAVEGLNLDRADVFLSVVAQINKVAGV